MSGVYTIKNTANGHVYVGSAVNIEKRLKEHVYYLKRSGHCNVHLQRAWDKYGKDVFVFSTHTVCAKSDLIVVEQEVMDYYKEIIGWDKMYNISPTAGNTKGRFHSEETRKRIGEKSKGRWTGKKHTEETKAKMRIINAHTNKGRIATEEQRKRQSEQRKGKKFSEEHKANLSASLKRYAQSVKENGQPKTRTAGRKLSYDKAEEIREKHIGGRDIGALSLEYRVSISTIKKVIHRQTWTRPL